MPPPGLSSEAYNILSPQAGGVGMAACMRRALENAGLAPGAVDYINAHGTSTRINDLYETQAIHAVFGAAARGLAVSSTKSLTGHCLAGAAGVEAVICCKALVEGVVPPTWHLTDPDPELDLDFVPERAAAARAAPRDVELLRLRRPQRRRDLLPVRWRIIGLRLRSAPCPCELCEWGRACDGHEPPQRPLRRAPCLGSILRPLQDSDDDS